jgi:hypothetical protein
MPFVEYTLTCDVLYIGERPKKGATFKPCLKTIPFSQISGALNSKFGRDDFKAVGYLIEEPGFNNIEYLIYSPREKALSISKIPIQVEFISNVKGKVFILETEEIRTLLSDTLEIYLGGLRSKGFGKCMLTEKRYVEENFPAKPKPLNVRIPIDEVETFKIKRIVNPIYGYLFKPNPDRLTGVYVKSLFEGSLVIAPTFLLKE